MPFLHLRLSVPHPWQLSNVVEYMHCQSVTLQLNSHESIMKRTSSSLFGFASSLRLQHSRALHVLVDARETSSFCKIHQSNDSINLVQQQTLSQEARVYGHCNSGECFHDEDDKESQRKRKIGLANKGRVPWNKGKKHPAETRLRIKQRTIEALKDPKVKKKMSETSRPHSDETKARIGSSQRRRWSKHLRWKRLGEKFFISWLQSIAEAAKKGGIEEQELNWDSYDKIKHEIALEQIQWAAEKVKAKEMVKLRAERRAMEKAEKITRLAERKKEREKNALARRKLKRKKKEKLMRDNKESAHSQGLRLKQRLKKIRRKKSISSEVPIQKGAVISQMPALEKLDIDLVEKEKSQREVSLAEQIRAARNRRAESTSTEYADLLISPAFLK